MILVNFALQVMFLCTYPRPKHSSLLTKGILVPWAEPALMIYCRRMATFGVSNPNHNSLLHGTSNISMVDYKCINQQVALVLNELEDIKSSDREFINAEDLDTRAADHVADALRYGVNYAPPKTASFRLGEL